MRALAEARYRSASPADARPPASAGASSSRPSPPTTRRDRRERFSKELRSSGGFHEVIVEGFDCDSTCPRRVNVAQSTRHSGAIEGSNPNSNPGSTSTPRNDGEMDLATYAILLAGALAGGFVSGLAGFGTALMALGIWLYILPPSIAVPLVLICSVISQISTLPSMWKLLDFKLAWPFVIGGLARHADRRAAGRARRPASLQAQRRRDAAGVSDRAVFHPQADGVSLRRPDRRRLRRICRRHSRRPRRPVRPASDPVGQRARLDQGSAARRLPDLQRHRARRRAVPADRHRLRRS